MLIKNLVIFKNFIMYFHFKIIYFYFDVILLAFVSLLKYGVKKNIL